MKRDNNFDETYDALLSVIEGVPYGIMVVDLKGHISIINHLALKLLAPDKKIADVINKKAAVFLDQLPLPSTSLQDAGEDTGFHEVRFLDKYLNISLKKILNGMVITLADITEVKEAQDVMFSSMLEGQEKERKRLAQELHDGIGPMLSTIKIKLSSIEEEFTELHEELWDKFKKSYQLIDDVSSDLRSVSHNLLPKVLLDFGLAEALETLCERVQKHKGLRVQFIHSGVDQRLDGAVELSLYRICQELINNTLKYAKASEVIIQLIKSASQIRLIYEDNGQGFSPHMDKEGIGHMNIKSRTRALGGEVEIDSQPDKGMTAIVIIPLTENTVEV